MRIRFFESTRSFISNSKEKIEGQEKRKIGKEKEKKKIKKRDEETATQMTERWRWRWRRS